MVVSKYFVAIRHPPSNFHETKHVLLLLCGIMGILFVHWVGKSNPSRQDEESDIMGVLRPSQMIKHQEHLF